MGAHKTISHELLVNVSSVLNVINPFVFRDSDKYQHQKIETLADGKLVFEGHEVGYILDNTNTTIK